MLQYNDRIWNKNALQEVPHQPYSLVGLNLFMFSSSERAYDSDFKSYLNEEHQKFTRKRNGFLILV
jgi:hypothetical protein